MTFYGPYSFHGLVKDTSGNIKAGLTITLWNLRTGETVAVTTASDGSYSLNIANLTSGYVDGDFVLITVGDIKSAGKHIVKFLKSRITRQLKANCRNEFRQKLFDPILIEDRPMPYEEDKNIFRHVLSFRLSGVDLGE